MSEQSTEKSPLVSILEYGAIIVTFLTIIGYLKVFLYYKYYKIDISNFISFEEVLTPFIDDLLFIVFLMILNNSYVYIMDRLINRAETLTPETKGFWPTIKTIFTGKLRILSVLTYMSVFITMYTLYLNVNSVTPLDIYCNSILFLTSLCIMFTTNLINLYKVEMTNLYNKYRTIFIAIIILSIVSIYNVLDVTGNIRSNEKQYEEIKYSFSFDNYKVDTDSSIIFIGRTKEKLFIRNVKENRTDIYNTSEIKNEYVK